MRELDVLLLNYLERHFPDASPAEQRGFIALLEFPDPVLLAYLTGRDTPADPMQSHVIGKIATSA